MRINKSRLRQANLLILSIGGEIKTESDFMQALEFCIDKIKRGQASRQENTLNETWGINDLEKLIDCIDYKEQTDEPQS